MKAFCLLTLLSLPAFGQAPAALRQHDGALTNLLAVVAAEQAGRTRPVLLPWTDDEPPSVGTPRAFPASWSFATNRIAALPMRCAVWTFDGPAGLHWCLVTEARVGQDIYRRALWPVSPVSADLTPDWDQLPAEQIESRRRP